MSAHTCTSITPGCYRCDLGREEAEAARAEVLSDAKAAWLDYRDGPMRNWPTRQLRRRDFLAGYLAANGLELMPS